MHIPPGADGLTCLPHLTGIAAGNVEEGERIGNRFQRLVEDPSYFLVGERIAIDELLVGRPLSLELLESGLVIDRAPGPEMVNVAIHDGVCSSLLRNGVLPQLGLQRLAPCSRRSLLVLERTFCGNARE